MSNLPFRTLFREFLFRMVELEVLVPKGDMSKLLGQVAALLILLSIVFVFPALGVGSATAMPAQLALLMVWSGEHFLIATTMLIVGLFAVLSWDSTFPSRRDVLVLAPLPIRARTLFLAKVAAVATSLSVAVLALHLFAGIAWPVAQHFQSRKQPAPALTYEAAMPPVDAAGFAAMLDRDMQPALKPGSGPLAPEVGAGLAAGVVQRGERRIVTYGTAKPDSIFEIASISKTFTALVLAQMVAEEATKLQEPVRTLLPDGMIRRPLTTEITLLDLATHRSGLPGMPDNLQPADPANPAADYHVANLYAFLKRHGVERPRDTSFEYSNLGFSLLGQALANRAGMSWEDLLKREVTGPLGLHDTVVTLSPEHKVRFIPGQNLRGQTVRGWDMDALAPAGGLHSTAGDMLTFLEAQLHPERWAGAGTLAKALAKSHEIKADAVPGMRIALGWLHYTDNGAYWHNGATGGYSSYAFFDPKRDFAGVVLFNQRPGSYSFADHLGEHIRQRLAGEPVVSLDHVVVPENPGFGGFLRLFCGYWLTMFLAGAFIFCFVLGLQGIAAQLLPRPWFLQVSSGLQLAVFCVLVVGYMVLPKLASPSVLLEAQNHGPLYWSPTYWFLGLMQQLSGSPALAPLAKRAWIGIATTLALTATAYMLSYFRTLRQIVEEPDIVARSNRRNWLPSLGRPLATAVSQFSIRTLFRSRQHRLILAFYWGLSLAGVIFVAKSPSLQDILHQPAVPTLVVSIVALGVAIVGIRVVVTIPFELRANWIFQITPVPDGGRALALIRRPLYLLGAAPVWLASATIFPFLWPWQQAAGHLAVLILLGVSLTEFCLWGFRKVPFTCSYLPGKSKVNMAALAYLAIVFLIVKGAEWEMVALADRTGFIVMMSVLAVLAGFAWWRTADLARWSEPGMQFEEAETPAIFALDLHRDGTPVARAD